MRGKARASKRVVSAEPLSPKIHPRRASPAASEVSRLPEPAPPAVKKVADPAPRGIAAIFEHHLRRFKTTVHLLTLAPLYALACVCMGIAAMPSLAALQFTLEATASAPLPLRLFLLGTVAAAGFFAYGVALMAVVPVANLILVRRLQPWRGSYYSAYCLRWYLHNGLIYLVRYTFLDFVTPTPLNVIFYRLMGMKVGDHTQINTSNISDASLIELGDRVTLGGSATVVGHYGMGGFLIMAPVKIGAGATIGLKATIMGGVEIGENARIMPNSVVLPRTKVPAGEIWGGVPARKIDLRKAAA